jgi:hypothetical protein
LTQLVTPEACCVSHRRRVARVAFGTQSCGATAPVTPDRADPEPASVGVARVGLCGWTISMSAYVRRFPVVEVQHTFYDPPSDAVLMRWRASAPPGFEFTIKAWQLVTHEASSPTYRRLKRPIDAGLRSQVGAFRLTDPGGQRVGANARVRTVASRNGGLVAMSEKLLSHQRERRAPTCIRSRSTTAGGPIDVGAAG